MENASSFVMYIMSLTYALLYSLRCHCHMDYCGFIADNAKFLVYFPTFSMVVNDEFDSYLDYKLLGRDCKHFDYIQPKKVSASGTFQPRKRNSTTSNTHSHVIPPDDSDTAANHSRPPLPAATGKKKTVTQSSKRPSSLDTSTPPISDDDSNSDLDSLPPSDTLIMNVLMPKQPHKSRLGTPPERINTDDLLLFSNDPSAPAPAVWPCDTPNGSDGLRRFQNYEHFCLTSKDSKFINGGEPTPSLG